MGEKRSKLRHFKLYQSKLIYMHMNIAIYLQLQKESAYILNFNVPTSYTAKIYLNKQIKYKFPGSVYLMSLLSL